MLCRKEKSADQSQRFEIQDEPPYNSCEGVGGEESSLIVSSAPGAALKNPLRNRLGTSGAA
jgi:hypothetical protein